MSAINVSLGDNGKTRKHYPQIIKQLLEIRFKPSLRVNFYLDPYDLPDDDKYDLLSDLIEILGVIIIEVEN